MRGAKPSPALLASREKTRQLEGYVQYLEDKLRAREAANRKLMDALENEERRREFSLREVRSLCSNFNTRLGSIEALLREKDHFVFRQIHNCKVILTETLDPSHRSFRLLDAALSTLGKAVRAPRKSKSVRFCAKSSLKGRVGRSIRAERTATNMPVGSEFGSGGIKEPTPLARSQPAPRSGATATRTAPRSTRRPGRADAPPAQTPYNTRTAPGADLMQEREAQLRSSKLYAESLRSSGNDESLPEASGTEGDRAIDAANIAAAIDIARRAATGTEAPTVDSPAARAKGVYPKPESREKKTSRDRQDAAYDEERASLETGIARCDMEIARLSALLLNRVNTKTASSVAAVPAL